MVIKIQRNTYTVQLVLKLRMLIQYIFILINTNINNLFVQIFTEFDIKKKNWKLIKKSLPSRLNIKQMRSIYAHKI